MPAEAFTISQTAEQIRLALRRYIEATYHIGHPMLIKQRQELLDQEGVIYQAPYIESTPRYAQGKPFCELDIPSTVKSFFTQLGRDSDKSHRLLWDPPYTHQAEALEQAVGQGKSLAITTGTGSGKTESFLMPMLAGLAQEAAANPTSFQTPAVRALILYPMNALVNDQLGRLRTLLGDERVAGQFKQWAGRPARFARYTSRTLYPGVRTAKRDGIKLKPLKKFYLELMDNALGEPSEERDRALELIDTLQSKGKWPAKPDLRAWYGSSHERWEHEGEPVRAVTQTDDVELLTRHEVLATPPDVLITNYSMLEYMMMRPLERPVFDKTSAWLAAHPGQQFLLIIDEAHLYRGSAGAEVALLLRRFRTRLGIEPSRLQVICTSASFNTPDYARQFAAQLSGKDPADFVPVRDQKDMRPNPTVGSVADAEALAAVDIRAYYSAGDDLERLNAVRRLLDYLDTRPHPRETTRQALYRAFRTYNPMSLLVNTTMGNAEAVAALANVIFPGVEESLADRAVSNLIALGSAARSNDEDAGLLPSRVHAFFRGLPGLWACLDRDCSELADDQRGEGPVGKLYAQPHSVCRCGARVFELYTCRNCGTAYARAYTDNLAEPAHLWNEGGAAFESASGAAQELVPLDLLLEQPDWDINGKHASPQKCELDLITGELKTGSNRYRVVYLPGQRGGEEIEGEDGETSHANGEFKPCGVCHQKATSGRSYVQDHQTKGDQPFQALITRQLEVQTPGHQEPSPFAPLQGRKVLAFSDSRQVAARLAPNLVEYSMRDVIRPVLLRGWSEIYSSSALRPSANLDAAYLAAIIGAKRLSVRLRPEIKQGESLHVIKEVGDQLDEWDRTHDNDILSELIALKDPPPESLLRSLFATLTDRFTGLTPLGLASLAETRRSATRLATLPDLPGIATSPEAKQALVRMWLDQWASQRSIKFSSTPGSWFNTNGGVKPRTGNFRALESWFNNPTAYRKFKSEWLRNLLDVFCCVEGRQHVLLANKVALKTDGEWAYCPRCRTAQRPFPGILRCIVCQSEQLAVIDPMSDVTFRARKGYYRLSTEKALSLSDEIGPVMSIVAAEHTAQLNDAHDGAVFSKAEENELLFQDIDLFPPRPAIDVLSCTTTMEVGIDIGSLSGVALRNMPPSRANYQQRSGRAGRRGNAVASVVAFGSSDTHDDHYFRNSAEMISGDVIDPVLTMDNKDIVHRHITAFLLQQYHRDKLPVTTPEQENRQLFEVLGTVTQFTGNQALLTRDGFETWLLQNQTRLGREVSTWLPTELTQGDKNDLVEGLITDTLADIDRALRIDPGSSVPVNPGDAQDQGGDDDVPKEDGADVPNPRQRQDNLLDRLLYEGVLPKYAFPTDVVSFYVFDADKFASYRPEFQYSPSQGLTVALSQYAPGRTVWIDNKEWTSGAVYSPMRSEREEAWKRHKVYFECSVCHYAKTKEVEDAERGQKLECPACKSEDTFGSGSLKGKSMNWMRPPGFAHRTTDEPGVTTDDSPEISYATRAKLVGLQSTKPQDWTSISDRIEHTSDRYQLLVTNTGPRGEGYDYCTKCGLIEASASPSHILKGEHNKPYPDTDEQICSAPFRVARGIALGTDFISDVLLIRVSVDKQVSLNPWYLSTQVALRTVAEAITLAAADLLEIEATEVQAEFRPALTQAGAHGKEAEIYLYDTLAGGAGFTRRIHDLGRDVYELALDRLENCPAGCDESCYRCLRSFRNKFDHAFLDRKVGAALLRHLLYGTPPVLDEERLRRSTDRLAAALQGMDLTDTTITRDSSVDVPGIGAVLVPILVVKGGKPFAFYVCSPLSTSGTPTEALHEAEENSGALAVKPINDIFISKNLPHACKLVSQVLQ